jgi:hypothetical protein
MTKLKIVVAILMLMAIAQANPIGQCYQGCKDLMPSYPGSRIAYWGPNVANGEYSPLPSHIELILLNGSYLDAHYGVQDNISPPDATFKNFAELDNYITIKESR